MERHRPVGVLVLDDKGRIVDTNDTLCSSLGYRCAELAGMSVDLLLADDEVLAMRERLRRPATGEFRDFSVQMGFLTKRGKRMPLYTTVSRFAPAADMPHHHILHVSPAWGAEPEALFKRFIDKINAGIVLTDAERNIVAVNSAFRRITGYGEDDVLGRTPRLLQSGRHDPAFYQNMWRSIEHHGYWHGEIWNRRRSGEVYPERLLISAVKDDGRKVSNYVGIFYDVSVEVSERAEQESLAYRDPLTGLPNRRAFVEGLDRALMPAQRNEDRMALLFIDLDNFKAVNDNHGHIIGDQVLIEVARRLNQAVRKNDSVARWGGDELVMLIGSNADTARIRAVADKLLRVFSKPIHVEGNIFNITVSIGIARFPQDAAGAAELIEMADAAMYLAKRAGRAGYFFANTIATDDRFNG